MTTPTPDQDPTTPPTMTQEGLEERMRYEDMRQALVRSQKALARSKYKDADLVAAVYQAAKDAAQTLVIPPVPKPTRDARKKDGEVAVAVMGDWQLGKVTRRSPGNEIDYNSAICETRIEEYVRKVISLTEIQRADHPVKTCHVWLLGDLIEGISIFPGQQWLVDSSLYRQIVVDGPRILANALRHLLANFDAVHVTAIIGNHGRLGRKGEADPESNGDRMLYRITQQLMADEKRLTWTIPDGMGERHWYAIDRIGNYSCLLLHGDQIRGGFAGFPFYGLAKRVWGWKAGAIPEEFKDVMFGHYHQRVVVTLNKTIARCNGSTESWNSYAQESLAAMGDPSQSLLFVHPEKGMVTAEYQVWLT